MTSLKSIEIFLLKNSGNLLTVKVINFYDLKKIFKKKDRQNFD